MVQEPFMQKSLFDEGNLLKLKFHKKIAEFKLSEAIEVLVELAKTFDAPSRIEEKRMALFALFRQMDHQKDGDAQAWAQLYHDFPKSTEFAYLKDEWTAIQMGIFREIAQRLKPSFADYVYGDLHAAEVFLEIGEFEDCINVVHGHILSHGENSFLRQLQACALIRNGESKAAGRFWIMALFNNPVSCREGFFPNEDNKREWQELAKTIGPQRAWLELPFLLWRKEKIVIEFLAGAPKIDTFKEFLLETVANNQPMDEIEHCSLLLFNRILYLAEACRLMGGEVEEMVKYRQELDALDHEKFLQYLALIKQMEAR